MNNNNDNNNTVDRAMTQVASHQSLNKIFKTWMLSQGVLCKKALLTCP
jgi:hypothetical protein